MKSFVGIGNGVKIEHPHHPRPKPRSLILRNRPTHPFSRFDTLILILLDLICLSLIMRIGKCILDSVIVRLHCIYRLNLVLRRFTHGRPGGRPGVQAGVQASRRASRRPGVQAGVQASRRPGGRPGVQASTTKKKTKKSLAAPIWYDRLDRTPCPNVPIRDFGFRNPFSDSQIGLSTFGDMSTF